VTPLVLGLALTAPTQPPFPPGPPVPFPPVVRPVPVFGGVVVRPRVLVYPVASPPVPVPVPAPVAPAVPALTLEQFSRVFTPTPGPHHYWIVHPRTCQPVEVCFTLPPCGRMDRLQVNRNRIKIELDRPDFEVDIEFRHNGTVRIKYDD
jgi:hypothetical protein